MTISQIDPTLVGSSAANDHTMRHKLLHERLDELVADFLTATGKRPSQATVLEMITWSHEQTIHTDDDERV